MNIYEQGVKFSEHSSQFRSDRAGKSAVDAAADPDNLHVLQLPQPAQYLPKMLREKQKRVAARQEHVLELQHSSRNEQIQDVLLSGGDPLLLPPERLREILSRLRELKHVQIIRIGSRVPCALPRWITPELAAMLAEFHPLFINIHFNHPAELTADSERACAILANAGIPLGSQTVLLRGVNDSEAILAELFHRLLSFRVRPYYLMQMDLATSTAHFRTPISTGLRILRKLRNRISGPAMPHFVVDLPGGRGKIPLLPNMIREIGSGRMILQNYLGELCHYPLLDGEEQGLKAEVGWRMEGGEGGGPKLAWRLQVVGIPAALS